MIPSPFHLNQSALGRASGEVNSLKGPYDEFRHASRVGFIRQRDKPLNGLPRQPLHRPGATTKFTMASDGFKMDTVAAAVPDLPAMSRNTHMPTSLFVLLLHRSSILILSLYAPG